MTDTAHAFFASLMQHGRGYDSPNDLGTIAAARPAWHAHAACRGTDPKAFYSGKAEDIATAKALCRTCPVRPECDEAGALEDHGTWGGEQRDRKILSRTRREVIGRGTEGPPHGPT